MTGTGMLDPRIGAAIVAIVFAVCFFFLRRDRRRASVRRVERLNRAAELLREHAGALRHFLGHAEAPAALKTLLVGFSDAMENESLATSIAESIVQPRSFSMSSEAQTLLEAIGELQRAHPDLAGSFERALGTATVAGFLRWEGAAHLFEPAMATIVADPRRECVAAVEGAKRSGVSGWPLPAASPAAA